MLKRSFAEFHAQRAAPEALEALQAGQERLAQLRARPWPHSFLGTSRRDVEEYHSVGRRIEALSSELQVSLQSWLLYRTTGICSSLLKCLQTVPPQVECE